MPEKQIEGFMRQVGALFSVAGLAIMVMLGSDSAVKLTACLIYAVTLIILYNFTAIYKLLPQEEADLEHDINLDCFAFYLLAASTATPFFMITLNNETGLTLLLCVWVLSVIGIIIKMANNILYNKIICFFTLLVVLISIKPVSDRLPAGGLFWIGLGLVLYLISYIIHEIKGPRFSKYLESHRLSHIFVILGSLSHFIAILFYVVLS